MRIRDIMTQPVRTCRSAETAAAAARIMWDHDCGAVPVVDEDERLLGMVTDRDLCMAAYTQGKPLDRIPVTVAMSKTAFTCAAEDAVEDVERVMAERRIRRVPIVDLTGRPIGIVSLNDVARRVVSLRTKVAADRHVLETLVAVCTPRGAAPRVAPRERPRPVPVTSV